MEDGKRWITWRGRRILVNANGNIVKDGYSLYREFTKAKRLDTKEYDKLRNDFEKSLTDDEKHTIEMYKIGPGPLNNREHDNWKLTYRIIDKDNPKGYVDKKLNDVEAFNQILDDEALKIKTKDKSRDENVLFNHERMKAIQKDAFELDKIFEKKGISLDKDMIVYRKGYESLKDIEKGYVRPGFTSTSAMSRINKKTPGGLQLGNNEFEILIPKGMKFLPIENIGSDAEELRKQHEILLPRNIKFKLITDKSKEAKFDITKKNLWTRGETRYLVRAEEVKK